MGDLSSLESEYTNDTNEDEEEDLVTISQDTTRKIIACEKCGEIHIVRRYSK